MDWTPEEITYLTHAWETLGLTASMIAAKLSVIGTKRNSNAVIGKAHRLGLTKRPSPIRRNVQPKPKRARKKAVNRPMGVKQPKTFSHKNRGRAYQPAEAKGYVGECLWPMWSDTEKATHVYCKQRTVPGKSYCQEHCRRAYTGVERVRV